MGFKARQNILYSFLFCVIFACSEEDTDKAMSMSFGYFVLYATVSNTTHYTIYRQSLFVEY